MEIITTSFGPKKYLAIKKTISFSELTNKEMYDQVGQKLSSYAQIHTIHYSAEWVVLYFNWNAEKQVTDLAIGFPINQQIAVEDPELCVIDVPALNSVMTILTGPYEELSTIHSGLTTYVSEHGFNVANLPVISIEEYVVDPKVSPDPLDWKTNVYHFYN